MNLASDLFRLGKSDIIKALVMAALTGAGLPIAAAIQTPGFNLFAANWSAIGQLALNGAVIGFITYLAKNFLSDKNGAFMGTVGGSVPPGE